MTRRAFLSGGIGALIASNLPTRKPKWKIMEHQPLVTREAVLLANEPLIEEGQCILRQIAPEYMRIMGEINEHCGRTASLFSTE